MLKYLLTLIFSLFFIFGFAQVKVSLNEIDRILFTEGNGGFGGYEETDYAILHESNRWVSYQIHQKIDLMGPRRENVDSAQHQLIKVISEDSILAFLQTIAIIKPKFNAASLGITVGSITSQINEKYFRNKSEKAKIFDSFFDTPGKLYPIINGLQRNDIMDFFVSCGINIVKKDGDTLKLYTREQPDFMLPWKINGIKTYDIGISKFFVYATNVNNRTISGAGFVSNFYESVEYKYARDAFGRIFWKETAPENVKYLEQYFDIVSVNGGDKYSPFLLHPKEFNQHVLIGGTVDIQDKRQIERLCRLTTDTLRTFFVNKAFMIDSCFAKNGCKISFPDNYGELYKKPFVMMGNNYLDQLEVDQSKFILFSISLGERIQDNWVALPDGTFLLTAYLDDYAIGVIPAYIKKDGVKRRKFVFKVFSANGGLLRSYGDN